MYSFDCHELWYFLKLNLLQSFKDSDNHLILNKFSEIQSMITLGNRFSRSIIACLRDVGSFF